MRRRGVVRNLVVLSVLVVWLKINFQTPGRYTGHKPWGPSPRCKNSDADIRRLVNLAYKVHLILENMGIDCWLMYGSIWGPLRGFEGPLPWDDDIDIGINGDGKFNQIEFEEFKIPFTVLGLSVENRLRQSSIIIINEEHAHSWPSLDLFVFFDVNGIMKRPGLESWLTPIHFYLYHSFPSKLVKQPLPKVKFGFFNISVPRNGIEIMKHLYPFNWWKVVRPFNCKT